MPNRFNLTSDNDIHVLELNLPYQIDQSEFDKIIEDLAASLNGHSGGKWIVDLSHVEYTGSAALGLLVNVRQQIKESGGSLVLCGVSPRLSDILHACSLDRLFKMVTSRQAALKM
jgi:anti-anti-sigma factor